MPAEVAEGAPVAEVERTIPPLGKEYWIGQREGDPPSPYVVFSPGGTIVAVSATYGGALRAGLMHHSATGILFDLKVYPLPVRR